MFNKVLLQSSYGLPYTHVVHVIKSQYSPPSYDSETIYPQYIDSNTSASLTSITATVDQTQTAVMWTSEQERVFSNLYIGRSDNGKIPSTSGSYSNSWRYMWSQFGLFDSADVDTDVKIWLSATPPPWASFTITNNCSSYIRIVESDTSTTAVAANTFKPGQTVYCYVYDQPLTTTIVAIGGGTSGETPLSCMTPRIISNGYRFWFVMPYGDCNIFIYRDPHSGGTT